MKTAISLDDETFHAAETLAGKLGMSRSELYATALRKYLREQEEQAITEAYNRVYDALTDEDRETEALVVAAGRRTLSRSEW